MFVQEGPMDIVSGVEVTVPPGGDFVFNQKGLLERIFDLTTAVKLCMIAAYCQAAQESGLV